MMTQLMERRGVQLLVNVVSASLHVQLMDGDIDLSIKNL